MASAQYTYLIDIHSSLYAQLKVVISAVSEDDRCRPRVNHASLSRDLYASWHLLKAKNILIRPDSCLRD